jgi:hypothetical protein
MYRLRLGEEYAFDIPYSTQLVMEDPMQRVLDAYFNPFACYKKRDRNKTRHRARKNQHKVRTNNPSGKRKRQVKLENKRKRKQQRRDKLAREREIGVQKESKAK